MNAQTSKGKFLLWLDKEGTPEDMFEELMVIIDSLKDEDADPS